MLVENDYFIIIIIGIVIGQWKRIHCELTYLPTINYIISVPVNIKFAILLKQSSSPGMSLCSRPPRTKGRPIIQSHVSR